MSKDLSLLRGSNMRTINDNPESRFESVFNHVNEGILIANANGSIIVVNPKCSVMFGYTESELKKMVVEQLIPHKYLDRHVKHRESYMHNPTKRPMGKNVNLRALRKDGSQFPVEISLSYYKAQEGELFVIAFIIDITERFEQQEKIQKFNEELRVLNETLEKKVNERTLVLKEALHDLEHSRDELTNALEKEKELNEMKSRFISMASHEFRTPLSTILSSISLIAKYTTTEEQEKRDKHIVRIKGSVNGLTDILNDFLSLGKLEEGKIVAKITPFNCQEMAAELAAEIQMIAKPRQLILFEYSGDPEFISDKQLLRNVITNLLTNAIKFSPEEKTISLIIQRTSRHLKIEVKDQGIGIPVEDQKHLFERFFRGKNAANIQGTGLGLNIILKYLELLNGNIEFESALNQGTTFKLTIPLKK